MLLPDLPYGKSFDFAAIRTELNAANWEDDDENPGTQVRRVWLGTIFALTPSGEFYVPFACSNVSGDCLVCMGEGSVKPRTGKRIRARAKRRNRDFSRGTVKRGCCGTPAADRYCVRVQKYRHRATRASDTTCLACEGLGSISAARDERWNEALESAAESIGAHVSHGDSGEDLFIAECREVSETPSR